MSGKHVKLILFREVRDQLRDRRTLFMIFVLPILLYPLLIMGMTQMAQLRREQPVKVLLLGSESLPTEPPLIVENQFAKRWFVDAKRAELVELDSKISANAAKNLKPGPPSEQGKQLVTAGDYDAVIVVPDDFSDQLQAFRGALQDRPRRDATDAKAATPAVPSPEVYYNTAKEKSQLAYFRVSQVLNNWKDEIGRDNLASTHLPQTVFKPFAVEEHDLAEEDQRKAAMWSKVLPFLLLIWALTGAFYPAIDLCAGEKERGTLETLLSSPAERGDVVWGKLLTVMLFSMATALLNIASISVAGAAISSQIPGLGPPPITATLWLLVALAPMSAMFSALCLALASFARSTKEGQYYLMPLMLVALPLVIMPMIPGVELTLGNSLIPVAGVMLLLRSLMEGNYLETLPYIAPVTIVTGLCCLLSIRWAVDQFSSENVLFRDSERFDLGTWLRHLLRDREDTPNAAAAVFCGVLILLLRFFVQLVAPPMSSFGDLARTTLVMQIALIATPALIMAIMLTRSPRQTLLLRMPPLASLPAVVLLAVLLHPVAQLLARLVHQLYPLDLKGLAGLSAMFENAPLGWMLVVMALAPAVCEELAYRGFVLSGLRRTGSKWRAIIISAVFFGVAHTILQQSLLATLTGVVIGYIAVQTSSLLPCVVYHFTHNALMLLSMQVTREAATSRPWLEWLGSVSEKEGFQFSPWWVGAGAIGAALILRWIGTIPYRPTAEESLHEAIKHQSPQQSAAT